MSPRYQQYVSMAEWLSAHCAEYFEKMAKIENGLKVICHSDFTQGNVMVQEGEFKEKRTVAFIDWQSYFVGNGFIDLSLILLYGTEINEFEAYPDLYLRLFDFYYECLIKHGFDPYNHKSRAQSAKDQLFQMYQEGTFFALMRYLSGFGGWILHESDEHPLKRKFNNCLQHCLVVYEKLYAHLPKQEESKRHTFEKFTCRVMMSHVDKPYYGWELMSHRDDP